MKYAVQQTVYDDHDLVSVYKVDNDFQSYEKSTSRYDMYVDVFASEKEAINFCIENNLDYSIINTKTVKSHLS